jgi:hypothetical protein
MLSITDYLSENLIDRYRQWDQKQDQQTVNSIEAGLRLARRVVPNRLIPHYDKAVEVGRDIKTFVAGE